MDSATPTQDIDSATPDQDMDSYAPAQLMCWAGDEMQSGESSVTEYSKSLPEAPMSHSEVLMYDAPAVAAEEVAMAEEEGGWSRQITEETAILASGPRGVKPVLEGEQGASSRGGLGGPAA
eukprot:scaffold9849_cov79-Isochrysis_galbana.AAC.2